MAVADGSANLFFNRDTKVYAVQATANGASTYNVWEIPVQAGYSFSQSTNASQVTLNEMSDATGKSRRGQQSFNDSLSPAEWSFDTYTRPSLVGATARGRAPEEILWHSLLSETLLNPAAGDAGISVSSWSFSGANITLTVAAHPFKVGDQVTTSGIAATGGSNLPNGTYTITAITNTSIAFTAAATPVGTPTSSAGIIKSTTFSSTSTYLEFLPTNSNKTRLATFDLYFVLGANKAATAHSYNATGEEGTTTVYKIADAVVNEATMNFEIDGISTISWSGMGSKISEVTAAINFGAGVYTLQTTATMNGDNSKTMITTTGNMIRNRLTALNIVGTNTPINGGAAKTYAITLTGGSITISNNMNFLTPEVLGVVNVPLGHVTSTRSVSGSFTAYLDEATNGTIDLYQDLLGATTLVTNKFQLQFFVGGKADSSNAVAPGVLIDLGQAHLEIPSINVDDVIGIEMNFTALPTSISGTDEINKIRYAGVGA